MFCCSSSQFSGLSVVCDCVFFPDHNYLVKSDILLTDCVALQYFKDVSLMYICLQSEYYVSESLL